MPSFNNLMDKVNPINIFAHLSIKYVQKYVLFGFSNETLLMLSILVDAQRV